MSDTENDQNIRRSSRRRDNTKKATRLSALEILKQARSEGKVAKYDVNNLVTDVYEVVDEDEYNNIRRKRQNENFVVDDDGGGYVDTGDDDLDDYDNEDEIEEAPKSKKKKEKNSNAKKGAIKSFFTSTNYAKTVKDENSVRLDDDEALKKMIADLGDPSMEIMEAPAPSRNQDLNPFKRDGRKREASPSIAPRPMKKPHISMMARSPKVVIPPRVVTESIKVEQEDFVTMDDEPIVLPETTMTVTKVEQSQVDEVDVNPTVISPKKPMEDVKCKVEEPAPVFDLGESFATSDEPAVDVQFGTEEFYVEVDGQKMIRMYWLDAFEDPIKHAGTVYLFGRVAISPNRSASCCVVVKNIMRQVFFLPRTTRFVRNTSTDEPLNDVDVFEDIKTSLAKHTGSNNCKCRKAKRCLMKDGRLSDNAGEEADLFEIQYTSNLPRLPSDLAGETYSAVMNTTTTALERLLVEKDIMGPGWMDVSNYVASTAKQTYCEYEFTVDMERMKNISTNANFEKAAPLGKLLTVNVIPTLNGKDNEISMISMLFNPRCNLSNPNTNKNNLQRICMVCKPKSGALPFDIKEQLAKLRMNDFVTITTNEKALLSLFLAKLAKLEPDVIVGHDLAATMELLKSRLQSLGVSGWSRTSRLKRSVPLSSLRSNKAGHWEFNAGRLLVDAKLSAMELVRCRSYELAELCSHLLNIQKPETYTTYTVDKFGSSRSLLQLISDSLEDSYLTLRVVVQLNALPLAFQITNIVGGVTSRTLMGGRAERNEYLLLHAFNKGNYLAPDKHLPNYGKKESHQKSVKSQKTGEEGDDAEGDGDKAKSNKAQYAGGLVLEPKKGLYETLILLLDFNSLYPSIIQEYNICFTTIEHEKDGDEVPEVPDSSFSEGILPKEIRKLVERRREVKKLMKERDLPESKSKQLDIRQMALKLTANSMYGCLGFQYSRFYAKPLAALVTFKGREVLMHTKELVEKLGYSVVYGDTDSIMINTNSTDLQQAKKLGFEIKKQVNQCHRLLELDLDGVFKRMLLLKKKKYAALTVNLENETTKKELKGLDIVRRDWSMIAKDVGNAIVDLILNPNLCREELVAEIDGTLKKIRTEIDEGRICKKLFEISKQLTRNPKEYADLKAQPHAAVAARLTDSGRVTFRSGDIVDYIICEDGTTNSATQRAYHMTELEGNDALKIDVHYYLAQQIHPVVSRLCEPIEEIDAVRIAEALGMDGSSYRRSVKASQTGQTAEDEMNWAQTLSFDHCDSFAVTCRCGNVIRIRAPLNEDETELSFSSCSACSLPLIQERAFLVNQLENIMSNYVGKQHSSAYRCDDSVCNFTTLVGGMKLARGGLDCPKCQGGVLRKEYTTRQLFDQQSFFMQVLDIEAEIGKLKPEQKRALQSQANYVNTIGLYNELSAVVRRFMDANAYNRVDLAYLFAPMLKL